MLRLSRTRREGRGPRAGGRYCGVVGEGENEGDAVKVIPGLDQGPFPRVYALGYHQGALVKSSQWELMRTFILSSL